MNKYIERLPKQYRSSVTDFYKDDDGWWICLSSRGQYEFRFYESRYTIHEDTLKDALDNFRMCIREKEESKLYLAYGSNLNLSQMRMRCPDAKLVGYASVEDYRLIFRGSGSGSYLSIEPAPGQYVPCAVFNISERDELSLDRYEGYPRFYRKKTLSVTMNSLDWEPQGEVNAMVYYLPKTSPAGMPSAQYIRTCRQGYKDCRFDEAALRNALTDTWEEIK